MNDKARVLLVAVGAVFVTGAAEGQNLRGLQLTLKADSVSHVLGEPVTLRVAVVNRSGTTALIPEGADVWTGHVEVLIAFEDGGYREYRGPGWGLRDAMGSGSIAIVREQPYTTRATILYNHGVDSDHLNVRRAREIRERFLETGYALPTPGRYRVKARFHDREFANSIESAPIEITVREPEGVDREVWEVLKSDPGYGYFIQTGGPPGHPGDPANIRMMEALERLANEQPHSRCAEAIRGSISTHRELLERLRNQGLITH